MFQRFVSKLKPVLSHRPSRKFNTVAFKRVPLQKLKISTLSSVALTSLWAFNHFNNTQKAYNSSLPSGADPIEVVQEKCASIGTPEEEVKTIAYLKKHLEIYKQLKGEKSDEVAVILMLLGSHCIAAGKEHKLEGIRYTEQSCDIFIEVEIERDMFLNQLDDIAGIAKQISPEESIRLHEKVIAQKLKYRGEKSATCIFNYLALGELYTIQDNKDKANEFYDKAKNLLETQALPANDPNDIYYEACEKFYTGYRLTDSHTFCKKALEIFRKRKDRDDEKIAKESKTLDILAQNELGMGSPDKCVEYLKQMDEFLEKTLETKGDPYYFSKGQNAVKIGNIYFDQKNYKQALQTFEGALDSFQKISQQGSEVLVYITFKTIADIYVALNDNKKAYQTLNSAYQIAKRSFGDNHPNTKMDAMMLQELEKKGYNAP